MSPTVVVTCPVCRGWVYVGSSEDLEVDPYDLAKEIGGQVLHCDAEEIQSGEIAHCRSSCSRREQPTLPEVAP